jgi:hypothetical protein
MMPKIGSTQLPPNAALNRFGRASQMNNVPKRGKKPANIANKQGILISSMHVFCRTGVIWANNAAQITHGLT